MDVQIDNNKMWESFIRECYASDDKLLHKVAKCARLALSDQYLKYDNGEIVSIEPEPDEPEKPVEPKFKVGDWVVYECGEETATLQIIRIDGETYVFSDNSTLGVVDEDALRLWDITKDAKEGELLCEDSCIFIFKKWFNEDTKEALVYCSLFSDGDFEKASCLSFDSESTHPATKEQCDILFTKMAEAGYVWLSGKKQLVKLLFKEGDTVRKKFDGSIWHINYINENGYWGNHKPLFPIENQNEFELVEPKLSHQEVTKESDQELTELDSIQKIIYDLLSSSNGEWLDEDYMTEMSKNISEDIRKQIVVEVDIDAMIDGYDEENGYLNITSHIYRQGIEDTLNKIKG